MKVKITGNIAHPTYTAAKAAAAACFDPVKSIVSITAAATAPILTDDIGVLAVASRPAVNYVETIGKQTEFALALDDPKAADSVVAGLAVQAAKVGVTVTGTRHVCRHDEDPSKWVPCVAIPLGKTFVIVVEEAP